MITHAGMSRVTLNGRRHAILRVCDGDFVPMAEIVARVRAALHGGAPAPVRDRKKTCNAVHDLGRARLLERTAWGWTATASGVALKRRTEAHA